jgi:hypothetical protein
MKLFFLFVALFMFAVPGWAQNNDSRQTEFEKQRRDWENLQITAASSVASRFLHERLSSPGTDCESALNDAVLQGDKSIIPYLKARKEGGFGPAQYIDLALVALGETRYVDLAIEETRSEDPATRSWATWRLVKFKTKASYQRLYEMLDDVKYGNVPKDVDYLIDSMSRVTMDWLSSEVEDPPKNRSNVAEWKEWFKKNNLIDQSQ